MDSPSRIEIVKRGNAAFTAGDMDAIAEVLHPDLVTVRVEPDGAEFHGPEGLFEAVEDWTRDFSEWTLDNSEFFEVGDCVVACSAQTATSRTSGVPVQQDFWFVFWISGDRLSRLEIHASRDAAIAAAEG